MDWQSMPKGSPERKAATHRRRCPKCGYTEDYRDDNEEEWHVRKEDIPAIRAAIEQGLPLPSRKH